MTRRRAELGTIKTDEIRGIVQTQVTRDIVEAQRKKQVGDQLVITNNSLKNKEDDSLQFYKRGTLAASEVGEGSSIENAASTETTFEKVITVDVNKFGVYDAVSREAIGDARIDIVDGVTEEMGEALANKKDELILERLCNEKTDTAITQLSSSKGTLPTDNLPIISVSKIIDHESSGDTELSDWDFSPATGTVVCRDIAATNSIKTIYDYHSGASDTYQTSAGKDKMSMSDVAKAKHNLTSNQFEPDKLVVSPKFISFIEQNSDFVSSWTYQGDLPQNVEGRLYNLDVIRSDNLPGEVSADGTGGGFIALVVDSDKAMPYVPKSGVNVDRKDDKDKQLMKFYATERYGVGGNSQGDRLLKSNAVCVLAMDHETTV